MAVLSLMPSTGTDYRRRSGALRSQAAQSGSGTGNGELTSRDQHRSFHDTTEKDRRDQHPRRQTTESAD